VQTISNGDCAFCAGPGGFFNLGYNNPVGNPWKLTFGGLSPPDICLWASGDRNPCAGTGGFPSWQLFCDAVNWHLYANGIAGSVMADYVLSRAAWACLGTNVMVLSGTDGECGGLPATMTVSPA
jgi:hypothetical protein